ncbi:glycogen synthase GlgA [Amorphus sp. 3PC139-8]|uniref:glycogen synthase GlgA n=1 Tax=Amorphus sp. 3PC139-8 TaxID=2735676 RepID=UPI00345D0EFC
MTALSVLSVASEAFPLIKTGGLADVVGSLPFALAEENVTVRTLLPGYPKVMAALRQGRPVLDLGELFGRPARILAGNAKGLSLLVLDAPDLFDRPGNPYTSPTGTDWPDNGLRFGALSRAAAEIATGALEEFKPDVVHCHDWQAGLVPAYLHYAKRAGPPTVMTIHNIAFQGQMAPELLPHLGLPIESYTVEGVEYFGRIGFLKAAVRLSDRITTVSPTYAREIRSSEFGMGLEGLIRARGQDVSGVLNGIDIGLWDPANDPAIAAPFDSVTLYRRRPNKSALLRRFGLDPDSERLLLGVVSRLTWQKGIDLIVEALPTILGLDCNLVVLGTGDAALEEALKAAAARHPDRIAVEFTYDEGLAHQLQAGVDALLIPSRFEPCGLTQLCALRYGAVPVAARVGGLADTIIDTNEMARMAGAGTGVLFSPVTKDTFDQALVRTRDLYQQPKVWRRMQSNAMRTDVSWAAPAGAYAALYRDLVEPAVAAQSA